jgi:hypothetical protein
MGPYAGVDCKFTFYVHSRVDSNKFTKLHFVQPYKRVDLNPMPKSTLSPT